MSQIMHLRVSGMLLTITLFIYEAGLGEKGACLHVHTVVLVVGVAAPAPLGALHARVDCPVAARVLNTRTLITFLLICLKTRGKK